MDLEYIYGSDVGKEGFAKTNRNFSEIGNGCNALDTKYTDKFIESDRFKNYVDGREYLIYYHNKLRLKEDAKIILSGDSTTAGYAITDTNYLLENIITSQLKVFGVNNAITINKGHNSMNVSDWIGGYLAEDMALNPDLYIVRWGFNHDGATPLSTRVSNFERDLRSGLTTFRNSRTVDQASIILMTPNSGNDVINGRDKTWFDLIHPIIKQIARDYQCCFVDTYTYLYDSNNVVWQDEIMYDLQKTHVHPLETANAWIVSLLTDALIPITMRTYGVKQYSSADRLNNGDEMKPSDYDIGISIDRTQYGFPFNGQSFTIRQIDGVTLQINTSLWDKDKSKMAFRMGLSTTGIPDAVGSNSWGTWNILGGEEPWTPATLLNSWVNTGGANDAVCAYRIDNGGNTQIKGFIKDGITTAGTTIFTLPVGKRPLENKYLPVFSNGVIGIIRVSPNGDVVCISVSSNAWLSLDNISFKAEN
ncbi:MAG: SGNH/GDSL hydrolase family protein [Anaerotignaceae bacterium]